MRKKLLVGLAVVVVVGVAVAGGWYWREREKDRAAVEALKLDETVFTKDQSVDQSRLSFPPPATEMALSTLLDYILKMDFPECQGLKEAKPGSANDQDFRKQFVVCKLRLMAEIQRIREARDRGMVPRLIELAEMKTEDYGTITEKLNDDQKQRLHSEVFCRARFYAIYALGKIGDSRAFDPLLKLVDEPPPMRGNSTEHKKGCLISTPDKSGELAFTTTCVAAVDALENFKDQLDPKTIPALLTILDSYPPPNFDKNSTESILMSYVPACHIKLASLFGVDGLRGLLDKYRDPKLSQVAREGIPGFISQVSNPEAIPLLRELLHGTDQLLAKNAGDALASMARKDLVDEYIYMINNGNSYSACMALGRVKDPATIPTLIQLLDNNDISSDAVYALKELGPVARDAIPVLEEKLNPCNETQCYHYAEALAAIGGDTTLPTLFEFAINNPSPDGEFLTVAIGKMNSDKSTDILLKFVQNEGRSNENDQLSKKYKLLRQAAVGILIRGGKSEHVKDILCKYKDDPEIKTKIDNYAYCGITE